MPKGTSRGFTLIELLVVVAIIAVLIAILLPSLGRAKDNAKTVRCSSNLKQLYTGISIYANQNSDIFMPCCIPTQPGSGGSFQAQLWSGYDCLGPLFGSRSTGNGVRSGTDQATANALIAKMLDCPSVDHFGAWGATWTSSTSGAAWWGDYTYNQNVGYNQAVTAADGTSTPSYKTHDGFLTVNIKMGAMPRTTLVSLDDRSKDGSHDYSFGSLGNLVPPVNCTAASFTGPFNSGNGDGLGQAGMVHKMETQTNMLFADGAIITDDVKKLAPGGNLSTYEFIVNPHLQPAGSPF
jgi:prepilin-type N-terminal cleavage/methylation domain-containing protein